MKALKIVVIIFIILLGIFLIPPIFMPSELYIEESKVLKASPEVIWDQVNCLENWEKWDIWHQDTNMEGSYEGPECGEGAMNVWTYKNMDDGGSQTIVEAREYEYIKTFLNFQKMGTAESELFFEPVEEGTKVTWTLRSPSAYPIMRWVSTLLIAPGVSTAYTDGLKNLDELTKDMKPKPKYTTGPVKTVEVESVNALAKRSVCGMEQMGQVMGEAFGKLMEVGGAKMAGPPFVIWYKWEGEEFEFDNCIPVTERIPGVGNIRSVKTYSGNAVSAVHTGSYETTHYSWTALENYMIENNLESNGEPYEVYITDPQSEPDPSKWITELYWPVK